MSQPDPKRKRTCACGNAIEFRVRNARTGEIMYSCRDCVTKAKATSEEMERAGGVWCERCQAYGSADHRRKCGS